MEKYVRFWMNVNLHFHQIDYNKYKHQGLRTKQKKNKMRILIFIWLTFKLWYIYMKDKSRLHFGKSSCKNPHFLQKWKKKRMFFSTCKDKRKKRKDSCAIFDWIDAVWFPSLSESDSLTGFLTPSEKLSPLVWGFVSVRRLADHRMCYIWMEHFSQVSHEVFFSYLGIWFLVFLVSIRGAFSFANTFLS